MAAARIVLCLLFCTAYSAHSAVDIITEPRPGEEYVLVSSGQQTLLRQLASTHKPPEKRSYNRFVKHDGVEEKSTKKLQGIEKHPTESTVAIEEDKKALLRKGQKGKSSSSKETDIPLSELKDIKIEKNVKDIVTSTKGVSLEDMSEYNNPSKKPVKKTLKPVLTTTPPSTTKGYNHIPINFDIIDDINTGLLSSDVNLESAGSEQKQHSRIQIKKGPNGQDYEYEYVYYYYDDDNKKEGNNTQEKVLSSTDGPRNVDTKKKYSTIDRSGTTTAISENHNEVVPTISRQRGKIMASRPVDEIFEEDRLSSSTRFPPRSRNLAASTSTTSVPEVSSEAANHRQLHQPDNIADESSEQTRSRTHAHVRQPGSELVDLVSFKTDPGDIPLNYKEPPSSYTSESKTTTEIPETTTTIGKPSYNKASHREPHALLGNIRFQEILDDSKLPADYKFTTPEDTTEDINMAAMGKVALDLYAYLARENLNNEVSGFVDGDATTTINAEEYTTESLSTTAEPTTTTTTTTTTTPAPQRTTTTASPPTRPLRFRSRLGDRGRASPASSTSTTEAPPQEIPNKSRGRFGKPFGTRKTTVATAAAELSTAAPAERYVTKARRGQSAGRNRPSLNTPAPAQEGGSAPQSDFSPPTRPRLRPGLRLTTATAKSTTATDVSTAAGASADTVETTPVPHNPVTRGRLGVRSGIAALRPKVKLNLRPKLGQAAGTTEALDTAPETPAPAAAHTDAEEEVSVSTPKPEENTRGGIKLRGRLPLNPSPKPRVTVTQPPRRPNPLLKRKLAPTEEPTEAPKKASSETSEENDSENKEEIETEAATEPTPAPSPTPPLRGLDALFARRRAAAAAANHPVRPTS